MEQIEMDAVRRAAVWKRVAPELTPYPEAEAPRAAAGDWADELAAAIRETAAARRGYLRWARRCGGGTGQTLNQLAAESGRQLCRLRSLYFLETGLGADAENDCDMSAESLCLFLRRRYLEETAASERYARWAERAEDPRVADTLEDMAQSSQCHSDTLFRLLEQSLAQQGMI